MQAINEQAKQGSTERATAPLGSQQHEEKKLALLLTRGEEVVASLDMCEDVLLRSVRRNPIEGVLPSPV